MSAIIVLNDIIHLLTSYEAAAVDLSDALRVCTSLSRVLQAFLPSRAGRHDI